MDTHKYKIEMTTPDPGYAPFPVSFMDRNTKEVVTFDPRQGKPATISYKITKEGWARIRLARRGQKDLVIRTLLEWVVQQFGRHSVQWDGTDASGNIVDNAKVLVVFGTKDMGKEKVHREHDEKECFDPTVQIVHDGTDGTFGATLRRAPSDFGSAGGCEVRWYVDYALARTDRLDKVPAKFSYAVDTSGLVGGKHMLTVNIDDHQDHVGSASIEFEV